jgi:hypothetical protein
MIVVSGASEARSARADTTLPPGRSSLHVAPGDTVGSLDSTGNIAIIPLNPDTEPKQFRIRKLRAWILLHCQHRNCRVRQMVNPTRIRVIPSQMGIGRATTKRCASEGEQ